MATATATVERTRVALGEDIDGEVSGEPAKTRKWRGVYVSTPDEFRAKLEAEAEASGTTPALFVRDLLAGRYGVTLAVARTRQKYGSPEEAKAAQTARRHARADVIRAALEEYMRAHPELFPA